MLLATIVSGLSFIASCSAQFPGPQNIDELVAKVYGNHERVAEIFENRTEIPEFTPLPNWPNIAIAHNDTAIWKVLNLKISHYPLKTGRVTFQVQSQVTKEVPEDSTIHIFSYVNGSDIFNATVPICPYLGYAKIDCPVKTSPGGSQMNDITLQIPNVADGRLSFILMVNTPDNELVTQIAALIDLKQDGTVASEDDTPQHNEL